MLRFYTAEGELVPTPAESAMVERQRAEQSNAQLRQMVLNLLQSGMTLEQVVAVTGLTEEQIHSLAEQS